jgi:hypothetical protein
MFHFYFLIVLLAACFTYGFWTRWRTRKLDDSGKAEYSRSVIDFIELPLMSEEVFWRMIHSSRKDLLQEHAETLARSLFNLSARDIVAFDKRFRYYQNTLFTTQFCAAVLLFDSGASPEAVSSQIIARGRQAYKDVMKDPEAILDYIVYRECRKTFEYEAGRAYGDKTGDILKEAVWRDDSIEPTNVEEYLSSLRSIDQSPHGTSIEAEDIPKMFPRIVQAVEQRPAEQ